MEDTPRLSLPCKGRGTAKRWRGHPERGGGPQSGGGVTLKGEGDRGAVEGFNKQERWRGHSERGGGPRSGGGVTLQGSGGGVCDRRSLEKIYGI